MSLCFAQNDNVLTDELQKILNQRSNELIDINIYFKSQMPTEHLTHLNVKSDSKEVRREIVINELKKFSEQQQESVMAVIEAEAKNGNVTDINAHWLVNSINCKASRDVVYQLASHPDIKVMGLNKEDVVTEGYDEKDAASSRGTIASHVTHIQAEKVWDLGYTGKGVTVAVLDSGCNLDHVDIKDHLWTGNGNNGGYNFMNPGQRPMDNKGHGSHCAGIVCGDGTSGVSTGIAPDATLMVLKVNDTGGTEFDVMVDAIEYAVENGADIISISIGWWAPEASRKETFRSLFENALEANVVVAAAAGNNRESLATYPAPNNINSPADCPPPYLHKDQTLEGGVSAVISVGGVDEENNIIGVSSQGPVTWQNTTYGDYAYNPGMGLIRPDIVAQGASVKSLAHNSNTDHAIKGGTSMAAPAVAGVMALMLEKNPNLTPAELCRIIEETATPLSQTKSNDFGSGCINALAAVQAVSFDVQGAYLNKYNYTRNFNTGTNQNLELTLVNNGATATSGATTVTLTSNDSNVTVDNGSETISNTIAVNGTATCNFTINVSNLSPDNHVAKLTVTTSGGSSSSFEIEINISNELVAPSNITTQVQNLRDINLSWEATNNATSYNVYRDGSYIANTASTSYSDAGLEYGTLYTYTITSKRNELESESSREIRVLTGDNPETPSPTNVTVANNNTVSWTNSTDSKSSNVYRKESSSEEEPEPLASKIDGTSYTDGNWNTLPNGIYQYGVSNNHASEEEVYNEGFESSELSTDESTNGWFVYTSGTNWTIKWSVLNQSQFGDIKPYMGNKAAFISNTASNNSYLSYLVTPQFDFTEHNGSKIIFSFYYVTPVWTGYPNDINTLNVKISTTSNKGEWTQLWSSEKTDVSTWTKVELDLSEYAGSTFYIAFENVIGAGYCTGLDEVSINVEGSKESRIQWSGNIYKGVNVFAQDGDMNNGDNWATNSTPSVNDNVIIDANAVINGTVEVNSLTINEGASLTLNAGAKLIVNGDFVNTDADAFIINDGAQVVHNSENLPATFNMNIVNPTEWSSNNKTGWQFISSPVKDAKINDFIPQSSDYDLYRYDGTKNLEWINHKDENDYGDDDDPETPVTPTAPAAPVVTATAISSSQIQLSWEAVAGATSYKVYSVGNELTETTGTNYTVSYLQSNTSYCFSVSALNENGESAKTEACATTLYAKPITPYDFTATATGESTIELSWSLANRATSYNVYQGNEKIATVTETTYTVEELESGTEYCFTVTAQNEMGESDKTEEKCATTNKKAPTIVEVGINPDGSELVYLPVYDYSAYSISQQIYTSNDIALGSGKIRNISFRVGDKGSAATRQYEVYLKNITASSFQENGYEYFELSSSDKVYDGSVDVGNKQEWFTIEFTTDFEYTGGNVVLCVYDKTGTALNSSSYHNFYKYAASGRSLYNSGYSAYNPTTLATSASGMATAYVNQIRFGIVPDGPVAPAMPSLSAVATSSSEISLTWNSVPGATSYNVYQGNNKIAEGLTETAHVVGNLEAGTEYCFAVTAVNEIGESAKSEACVTTEEAELPKCIVDFILTDQSTDGWNENYLRISYDDGTPEENLTLEFGEQTKKFVKEISKGTAISVVYQKASGYTYPTENSFVIKYESGEIIAEKAQGSLSGTTTIGTFTIDCTPSAPQAPVLTAKAIDATSITLSWEAVTGAESYNVYQDGNSIATALTETTYDVADLTTGEEYCFTVTAVNNIGESEHSEEACATPEEMCDVVFTFNDSYYGYGLSGATFTISYGGETEQKSLSGTSQEFTLAIPSGSNVTATFNAGYYPSYISYVSLDVKYAGGDVIISLAKNSLSDGYSFEFTVDCTPAPEPEPDDPNSSASTFFYNFDDGSLEDFILIDDDGDTQNWETTKVYGKDDYIAISYSWKSGVGALSPDNYLITKNKYSITENSEIKFKVNAVNNCPEYYSVIIATNVNDIGSFISVYEGSCSSSNPTEISVDLSERAGSVFYIGIRHYNSYNQYNLSINDFQLIDNSANSRSATREVSSVSPSRGVFESAFQQGVGYMASYEKENTAVFKGNLNHEKSYVFPVSYNNEKDLANFHLLGNPFSFNMKWSNVTATNLASGYAVVNEEGGYTYLGAADDEIAVGDGFFVKAIDENPSISYSEGRTLRNEKSQSIDVVITGNAGSDNVVVNLGKADEEGFPKLKNFNEEITTIFVYNNDKSYGIYNCEEEVEEVPIYFNNTNGMGKYTISIDAKGDFENITLVDLVSGDETNMLVHDYNFTASQQENTKRFILKFVEKQQTTDNSNFVYQSGEELIVNTQGTVQIIDVVGRVVYNNVVLNESERINISGFTTGTYIVRVISDKDVMTQKVVVY